MRNPSIATTKIRIPTREIDKYLVASNGEITFPARSVLFEGGEAWAIIGIGLGELVGDGDEEGMGEGLTVLAAASGWVGMESCSLVPKNWTIIVVSTPSRLPSTTPTPISLYFEFRIFSLWLGDAIQALTAD